MPKQSDEGGRLTPSGTKKAFTDAERRRLGKTRRATAEQRRRAAAEKEGQEQPEPTAPVRIIPRPLLIGRGDPHVLRAVYLPGPARRSAEGRRPFRAIFERLHSARGLHGLRAYDLLMKAHAGRRDRAAFAAEAVEAVAGLSLDHLKRIGRRALESDVNATVSVDRLVGLLYAADGQASVSEPEAIAGRHIRALELLRQTAGRLARIIDAIDRSFDLKDESEAQATIHGAFWHEPSDPSRVDLVRVAALAAINPAPIWPQHAQDTSFYEVARFAAKLGRYGDQFSSRQVRLRRSVFEVARDTFGSRDEWPDHPDCVAAYELIVQIAESALPLAALVEAIEWHDVAGLDLLIGERS